MDAKRLKAEIYFNSISLKQANKKTSSDMPKKHVRDVFWTFNRLKILFSALIVIAAAYFISCNFPESGWAFFILIAYAYIATPLIGLFSNRLLKKRIKKTKFIKIGFRIYRNSEVPQWFLVYSLLSIILFGIITTVFDIKGSAINSMGAALFLMTPFIVYHLLCFIGDHPLTIWKAIEFGSKAGHNSHNLSLDQGYDFNRKASDSSPMLDTRTITNFGATGSAAAYTFDQNSFDRIWND